MRIGILASFGNPEQRGPWASIAGYRRVSQLVQVLSPLHEIHLYVIAKRPWEPVVPGCSSITVVANPHLLGQWLKLIAVFVRRRHEIDLWIAYNPSKGKLPILLPRYLGIPVVVDYCDKQAAIDHWKGGVRSRIYLGFLSVVERLLLRRIKAFFVISNRLKNEVLRVNPEARCLLYRGTLEPCDVTEAGVELSPTFQYTLYLGALYDFNGPGVLIRALGRIAHAVPDLRLLLVGPGPEHERVCLQELAAQEAVAARVEFHSGLSDAEVFGLLKRVDILALPYLEHPRNRLNFPTKLIEYLWAGKPVLASRVGEVPQAVQGSQVMLLAPGNVEEWASAMHKVCSDKQLSGRLGEGSARLFRERFSPDAARRDLDDFLTMVCTQSAEAHSR